MRKGKGELFCWKNRKGKKAKICLIPSLCWQYKPKEDWQGTRIS